MKLTAIDPNNNPIIRETNKGPVTPNILLIFSANLNMRYVRAKTKKWLLKL